jgi:tetratricopeptide (TPR) repeat protein
MPEEPKEGPLRPKGKSTPQSQPDTRIDVKGSDNVIVTASKSIAANIRVVFHGNWRPFAAVLFVVALLLATILWYVVPREACEFNGEFNVAVAEFVVQDENGNPIQSDQGRNLANTITSQIKANFSEMRLDTVTSYTICGPEQTGTIQTEDHAREFAGSTNATLVVYGTIKQSNDLSFFTPRFFVSHSAFKEAEEITGQHELGNDVPGKLDSAMILIESPGVQARVDGLSMLTIGLVYYSVDRLEEALEYFKKADNPAWVGSGKETVFLLTGNVYIQQASNIKDFSNLSVAEEYYQEALDINPRYGRAMIGQANVVYLRAYVEKDCDPAELEAAAALLEQALGLEGQPASANIESKVHFYRGQLALIRDDCQLPGDDWASIAEQEFTWVTARYEADKNSNAPKSIQYFASHAYARLGYLAYQRNDADSAIAHLQSAVALASPIYQAEYSSLLGDVYVAMGQTENAIESYQQAIAIAIGNGDAESAQKYREKLASVPEQ